MRLITEECLDRIIFAGQGCLRRAISEYLVHYGRERSHQGIDNRPIDPEPLSLVVGASVCRH